MARAYCFVTAQQSIIVIILEALNISTLVFFFGSFYFNL